MKYFSILISIAIIFAISYISTMTSTQVIGFKIMKHSMFYFNVSFYTLLIFFSGVLTGFCAIFIKNANLREKLNAYQKKHEKMSVAQDSNESEVSVLQAKVKTLEAALEKALNK